VATPTKFPKDSSAPAANASACVPAAQFPEFPEDAYLGVLADFAELVSQFYETPKEFLYFAAILQLGLVLCGRVRADFGSLATQPRLYGLKIAPVGTGKKSTADVLSQKFVRRALSDAAKSPDEEFWEIPMDMSSPWMFVLPGAGSGEGLLSALAENKRVFLSYDEFERFSKKAGADGSVLGTAVNELFEQTQYANATKENVRSVSGVYLGFSANIPLEQFESTSGIGRLQDLGLWSRLCFVVGDRRHRIRKVTDPPEELMQPVVDRLASYLKALPVKTDPKDKQKVVPEREIVLKLTPEAEDLWNEYETVIGYGPDSTRLDTIGMRLMTILAVTSSKQEIDVDVVRATFAFLHYQRTVRAKYKPSRAETIEAKVEESIMRCVKKAHDEKRCPIAEREIRRSTSIEKTYGTQQLRKGLDRLRDAGQLQESRTHGRARAYDVGPEAD
jgi:hypothetical protein